MKFFKKTQASLKIKLKNYIVPSIGSMWFFSIYTMVDGAFVGRGVGPDALTGVNLAMPYISFIFSIAILISVGSSNIVSYFLGSGDIKRANMAYTKALVTIIFIGFVSAIMAYLSIDKLTSFLGSYPEVDHYLKDYLKIIILFSPFFMFSYTMEVLIKADGNPQTSFKIVSLSAITNLILDYLFVIKFNYGIKGAAIATGISQLVSAIAYVVYFSSPKASLKLTYYKPSILKTFEIFKFGIGEALTELSIGFTTFLFNYSILRFISSQGLVSYSIIMYTSNLVLNTMIAINQASQPLVSYYYGDSNKKRLSGLKTLLLRRTALWGICFFLLVMIFAPLIVSIFISPKNNLYFSHAIKSLRTYSFSFIFIGFNIVISGFLTATQRPIFGLIISTLRGYVFISISLLIFPLIFPEKIIWSASTISEFLTLIFSILLFKISIRNLRKELN